MSFFSQLESGGTSSTVSQNWQTSGARHARSCQSLEAKPSGTSGNPCNETTGPTVSETEQCLVKPARGNSEEMDEDFCRLNHSESFIYMSVPPYGRSPDIKVPHTLKARDTQAHINKHQQRVQIAGSKVQSCLVHPL